MTAPESLHHLATKSEWEGGQIDGTYAPSSLDAEGFIHFSTTDQVPATSLRHYADVTDLVVITVDPALVSGEIRWENLTGTGVFPHLYARLELDAVVSVAPYLAGEPVG